MERSDALVTSADAHSIARLDERLYAALRRATESGDESVLAPLAAAIPWDRHDAWSSLSVVYDLSLAPVDELGGTEVWQHHPAIARLRQRLEADLVDHLEDVADRHSAVPAFEVAGGGPATSAAAVSAMRRLARADAVPEVYRWLAEEATMDELVEFLSLEGGPDSGFDDLVAICQVGLRGRPKLELARNYWDEMGRGVPGSVHGELQARMASALALRSVPRRALPVEALERSVLGSFLVLSRARQPEAVGALGLLELQAGPRCRWVMKALQRLGAPDDSRPFYDEHAVADPVHGKDWLDGAVAELATDPRWAAGIVRGARWRAAVSTRFFAAALSQLRSPDPVGRHEGELALSAGRGPR